MNPLVAALKQLDTESAPDKRLEAVWATYESHAGEKLDRPPSIGQRRAVRDWVLALDPSRVAWLQRRSRLVPTISLTLLEKAQFIGQNACVACETVADDDGVMPLNVHFPVNIDPWSAQAKKARSKPLREAVSEELKPWAHLRPWSGKVCLSIVSIVPRSQSKKDVDNIVKGISDALQGRIYVNDRDVQCLISRIIYYGGPTGFYSIHARAVYPWDADTIYDAQDAPQFLSGHRITEA